MRSMWEWARASEAPHDGADRGDRQRPSVLRVQGVRPRGPADLLRYAGAEGAVREREAGDLGAGVPAEIEGGAQHPDPPDPDRPAHRPEDPRTVPDPCRDRYERPVGRPRARADRVSRIVSGVLGCDRRGPGPRGPRGYA